MQAATALIQVDPPKLLKMHDWSIRAKGGDFVGVIPGTAIVPVIHEERPEFDHRTHSVKRLDPVAYANRVVVGWQLEHRNPSDIIAFIKQSAGEIISARFTQTSQINMLAHAQLIALEPNPTAEMLAALEDYRKAYAWIKAVRDKSNELEQVVLNGGIPDFSALETPFV
jgi:hypothetical protein